jgi:hypothetical protein
MGATPQSSGDRPARLRLDRPATAPERDGDGRRALGRAPDTREPGAASLGLSPGSACRFSLTGRRP